MKGWRYGSSDPPPKWLMEEFKKGLIKMSQKRMLGNLFDLDNGWSFMIVLVPTHDSRRVADVVQGTVSQPPRSAVYGDLYPD